MQKAELHWTPSLILKYLAWTAIGLSSINILIQIAIYQFELKKEWFLLFNMDKEMNIPTLYSVILFLICVSLIRLIKGKSMDINRSRVEHLKRWSRLEWIFIFLAFDEAFQIHETLIISEFKALLPPILSMVWIIPYGILSILLLIYFLPLIFSMPNKVRNLTLLGGFTYISGALGLEIIGNLLVRTGDIRLHGISYGLITTLEETMEISGLIIFIYALTLYQFKYRKKQLNVNIEISAKKS